MADAAHNVIENVLRLTTSSEFKSADLNGDGILWFEEWLMAEAKMGIKVCESENDPD